MTLRIEKWTLADIADRVGGELSGEPRGGVAGVSTDTRTIEPGALFVALVGDRFDGHDYVGAAHDAGAAAAIVSRRLDPTIPQIVVDDTLVALQRLGAAIFDEGVEAGVFSVALTGSNGKTTTKELLTAIWSTVAPVHATVGNLNNHIGVPLTLCATPADARTMILEMGANRFGDISELVALAPADVRIITSIGHAHIEGLGSLDGVRRVKSEIFERSDADTIAVVPQEERSKLRFDGFEGRIVTVGEADSGADVVFTTSGAKVEVRGLDFEYHLRSPLPGRHNAHNLATAIAALTAAGPRPDADDLDRALAALVLPGGRWRTIERGGWTFLDDAYNANPTSVRASWDAFVEIRERQREVGDEDGLVVAVIGEMLELGDDAERLHGDTARRVAKRGGADCLVFVGTFASTMAQAAREVSDAEVAAFDEPGQVAAWLATRDPCTVYLKASRGQRLERIIEHFPADAGRDEA